MNTELIQGGMHIDARGTLRFCNDFDMSAVKRFYTIANSVVVLSAEGNDDDNG